MSPVRRVWSSKAVKKTLAIPAWLEEDSGSETTINISSVLQALKKELNVKGPADV